MSGFDKKYKVYSFFYCFQALKLNPIDCLRFTICYETAIRKRMS